MALIVGIIGAAVSIAATAAATYMQYEQQQQSAKAQRNASRYNAQVAENNATLSRQAGDARADDIRERTRRLQATARANAGASGIDVTPGSSPLEVLAYNARQGELDALRAEYSGEIGAQGDEATATLRFEGANAISTGKAQGASTILAGIGSAVNTGVRTYQYINRPPAA